MRGNIRIVWRWFFILIVLIFISAQSSMLTAKEHRYYVCIVNETDNAIKYSIDWCTKSGKNCTGYKLYSLPAGYKNEHWGPGGNKRMDIRIHTGGSHGVYIDYTLEGTKKCCQDKSNAYIRYNRRGYLRLYSYK